MGLEVLKQLEAERLLADTHVLTQVTSLKDGLRYNSNGIAVSFDSFWQALTTEIRDLPKITLKKSIVPGTEDEYLMELASGLESVYDKVDISLEKVLYFRAQLQTAANECKDLRASFTAWFTLALDVKLRELDLKLAGKNQSALAESEFSRIADGVEADLQSLLAIVEVQEQKLKNYKKLALNKYKLGQDQANAAWGSTITPRENGYGNRPDALLSSVEEPEEDNEEVPTFVSKRPTISKEVVPEARTAQGVPVTNAVPLPQEPVIVKGTFVKTLPPVALTPVQTDVLAQPNPTLVAAKFELDNGHVSEETLTKLVKETRKVLMTDAQAEKQRRGFAAANLALDNGRPVEEVRKEVDKAAEELALSAKGAAIMDQATTAAKAVIATEGIKPPKKAVIKITTNRPHESFATPAALAPKVESKAKVAVKLAYKAPAPIATVTAVNSDVAIVGVPVQPLVIADRPPSSALEAIARIEPVVVSPAPTPADEIPALPVPAPSVPATPRKPLTFTTDEDEVL